MARARRHRSRRPPPVRASGRTPTEPAAGSGRRCRRPTAADAASGFRRQRRSHHHRRRVRRADRAGAGRASARHRCRLTTESPQPSLPMRLIDEVARRVLERLAPDAAARRRRAGRVGDRRAAGPRGNRQDTQRGNRRKPAPALSAVQLQLTRITDVQDPSRPDSLPEKPALEGLEAKWKARWEAEGTYRFDRNRLAR